MLRNAKKFLHQLTIYLVVYATIAKSFISGAQFASSLSLGQRRNLPHRDPQLLDGEASAGGQ